MLQNLPRAILLCYNKKSTEAVELMRPEAAELVKRNQRFDLADSERMELLVKMLGRSHELIQKVE